MTRPYELARFAARNRNRVYEVVVNALESAAATKGITRKAIAQATGKKPSQISTTLSGPSNWTLDTVSDLLRSVGAEMTYAVVFEEDQAKSNVFNRLATTAPVVVHANVSGNTVSVIPSSPGNVAVPRVLTATG